MADLLAAEPHASRLLGLPRQILVFGRDIFEKRRLILELTKRDFKNRYAGSMLGIFWAFIQPLMMMMILWFVFTVGLKASVSNNGVPFVVWFFTGMIAWNFFADGFVVSSNVFNEYAFLVKKVNFRVSILPIVKLLASAVLHGVFLLILAAVLIANGYYPRWSWLQTFYYMGALFCLLTSLSWMSASLNVFLKDVGQIIGIVVQFGFWLTPVIWNSSQVPEPYVRFLKLNPMYYIVEGYRDSLIEGTPFWTVGPLLTAYFWGFTSIVFVLSIAIFRKLRPHFADVL